MTNLTLQQIRDAIQQGMEETWRLIDAGKKIELRPEPQRPGKEAVAEPADRERDHT
jgi:hypothetical protein